MNQFDWGEVLADLSTAAPTTALVGLIVGIVGLIFKGKVQFEPAVDKRIKDIKDGYENLILEKDANHTRELAAQRSQFDATLAIMQKANDNEHERAETEATARRAEQAEHNHFMSTVGETTIKLMQALPLNQPGSSQSSPATGGVA